MKNNKKPIWAKNYPYIYKLGFKVYIKPIAHINSGELKNKLNKEQQSLFNEYFGVQTVLRLEDGNSGLYLWDVELVLKQIFENYKPNIGEWD